MVQVNVTYKFTDNDKRDAFLKAIAENRIQEQTYAEKGCICYDYYIPVGKDCEVYLSEQWDNADAIAVHSALPHFLLLQEIKAGLVESTEIIRLKAEKL